MAVVVRSVAFDGEANTPSATVTKPDGTVEDDLLVAVATSDNDGSLAAMTAPAGWTESGTGVGGTAGTAFMKTWWKVATASEPASYTFPDSDGANAAAVILCLTGVDTSSPLAVGATYDVSTSDSTAHPAPSVAGVADGLLITAHCAEVGGTARTYTPPSGMTEQADFNSAASPWLTLEVNTLALTSSGATGTKTATCSGAEPFTCMSLVVAPAAGTTIDKTGGAATVGAGIGAKTVVTNETVRARLAGKAMTASTSHNVPLPAVTTGDRFIVCFVNDDTTSNPSVATGWTQVGTTQDQGTGTNHSLSVWTRVATGSDSLTVDLSVAQEAEWVVIALVGDGGTPQFAFAGGASAAAGAVTAITGLASGDYVSLVFLGLDNGSGGTDHAVTPPTGWGDVTTAFASSDVVGCWSMDQSATGVTGFSPVDVAWTNAEQWLTAHIVVPQVSTGTTIDKTGGAAALGAGSGAKTTGTAIPATAYDLARWHWTLPTEDPGPDTDAAQINQPELATYFDDHFYLDEDGFLVAVAPVNGATTSGSGATRSEGREHESNYDNSAWNPNTTGLRQFTITTRADPTSITGGTNPRQEEILYQIHGATGTPPIYFAAEWTSNGVPLDPGQERIRMFVSGTGMSNANVVTGITTTTDITIRVRVVNAELTAWVVAGQVADLPVDPTFGPVPTSDFNDQSNWYFKAGAYNKTDAGTGSSGQSIAKISHWELIQPGDATVYAKTGGAATVGAGSGAKLVAGPAEHAKAGGAAALGAGSGAREYVRSKAGGAAALGGGTGTRAVVRSKTGGAAALGAGAGERSTTYDRTGGAAAIGAGSGGRTLVHVKTGGAAALGAGSGAKVVDTVTIHTKTGAAAALGAGAGEREHVRPKSGGGAALGAGSGARVVSPAAVHAKAGGAAAVGAGIGHAAVGGAIEYSKTGGGATVGAGAGPSEVQHPTTHNRSGGAAAVGTGTGAREYVRSRSGAAAGAAAGTGAAEVAPPAVHTKTGAAAALGAGFGAVDVAAAGGYDRSGGAAARGAGSGAAVLVPPTVYEKTGGAAATGAGIALKQVIPPAVYVRSGGAVAIGAGIGRGRVGGAFHAGTPRLAGIQRAGQPVAVGLLHAGQPYTAGTTT